jgi:hypothetical protein
MNLTATKSIQDHRTGCLSVAWGRPLAFLLGFARNGLKSKIGAPTGAGRTLARIAKNVTQFGYQVKIVYSRALEVIEE